MQKIKILKKVNDGFQLVLDCNAQFNPETLKLQKKASWKTEKTWQKNIGNTTFTGGDPIKLSADLFFDTTNSTNGDVRAYTEPLMALTLVNLSEAGRNTSPEVIKEQLTAKKKEADAKKKAMEDMEKSGQKAQDEQNRRNTETQLQAARAEIERLEREGRQNGWNAHTNFFHPEWGYFSPIPFGIITVDRALEIAKQKEREYLDQLSQKTPYERATEDYQNLNKQIDELNQQSKGIIAGSKSAPPICKFVWGSFSFVAIMDSVNVQYLMFRPDGTPIRAKAKIKMVQIEEESFYPPQNPTSRSVPRKVWVVQEGQRLDWIAYQEYGSSAMWRYIAEINKLDNPMQLRPGQILNLI